MGKPLRQALQKKRSIPTNIPDLQRVIDKIYDDINELRMAINDYNGIGSGQGSPGDIRVTETGLEYRDTLGWKAVQDKFDTK